MGEKRVSRVTVFDREDGKSFFLEWREGARRIRRSLRAVVGRVVTDRAEAVQIATRISERLAVGGWRGVADRIAKQAHRAAKQEAAIGVAILPDAELLSLRLPLDPMCGVYFLLDGEDVVYVGQSRDVLYRITQHRRNPPIPFTSVAWYPVPRGSLDSTEAALIRRFNPPGNRYGVGA